MSCCVARPEISGVTSPRPTKTNQDLTKERQETKNNTGLPVKLTKTRTKDS